MDARNEIDFRWKMRKKKAAIKRYALIEFRDTLTFVPSMELLSHNLLSV